MLNGDKIRHRAHKGILKKASLRYIRLHDRRHIFASLLIQNGESLAYVKEQLGHHSIQITVDTYGHLVPGGNRRAVDRFDDDPQDTLPHTTIRNQRRRHHFAEPCKYPKRLVAAGRIELPT